MPLWFDPRVQLLCGECCGKDGSVFLRPNCILLRLPWAWKTVAVACAWWLEEKELS